MKTLVEIKDEVAIKIGYTSWNDYMNEITGNFYEIYRKEKIWEAVAKRYAEEALKEAAERAPWAGDCEVSKVCKSKIESSILNIIKELK